MSTAIDCCFCICLSIEGKSTKLQRFSKTINKRKALLASAVLNTVSVGEDKCEEHKGDPIAEPGFGGIAAADAGACTAGQDYTLYRAYGDNNVAQGKWWSMTSPADLKTKAAYYTANAICEKWNTLAYTITCTLKSGSAFVKGKTQSATCSDAGVIPVVSLGATDTIQIWIKDPAILTGCSAGKTASGLT